LPKWWVSGAPEQMRSTPWLHPAIVLYLEQLVQVNWSVLEHGSGGSTVWLSQRVASVTAVESDPAWKAAVGHRSGDNVSFYDGQPEDLPDNSYDLILIDGDADARGPWIANANRLCRAGGIVVLDNASRPEYEAERKQLQKQAAHWIHFKVNPPGHLHAVTDMYRMKGGETWI
jgi:predicted O-methyltransferase YrrM